MDFMGILAAAAVVAVTGIVIGVLLGVAGKFFEVEVDEKELAVRELLPGNNCGACGFAGCDAMAKAIAEGNAPVNGCPVGGAPVADQIAEVMGVTAEAAAKKVAYVKCNGTCDKTERKYNYTGLSDCRTLAMTPGAGDKACSYGCLGLGTCVKVCDFDAIHIVNGVAVVDPEKCTSCGKCANICPKHLIEVIPADAQCRVTCSSHDKGKDVKAACATGCIGCGICVKQCESGAITLENNVAYIDQEKCTKCGKCAAKCPSKIIL